MENDHQMDPFCARANYEDIILKQSHLEFQGLYSYNDWYFVVCKDYSETTLAADGSLLSEWFKDNKFLCCPIKIVSSVPNNAKIVPLRTNSEKAMLHGEPHTVHDIERELQISLPSDFPKFSIASPRQSIVVITERALTSVEKNLIYIACSNIGCSAPIEFSIKQIDENIEREKISLTRRFDTLELQTSRNLRHYTYITNKVRERVAEDEEFWIDNRYNILNEIQLSTPSILPAPFCKKNTSCFISVNQLSPQNLRTHLTLYQRVIMDFPLAQNEDSVLHNLSVTKEELFELASKGRIQFILPLSIERYNPKDISYLCDNLPSSLLFPRRLAAATIIEIRKRIPLLFPTFPIEEQAAFLRLLNIFETSEPNVPIHAIRNALGKIWVGATQSLQSRGAVGVTSHGIGEIAAEVVKALTGKDLTIEFFFAAMNIEWCATLGATYFPSQVGSYSDQLPAEICAALYSGSAKPTRTIVQAIPNLEDLVQNLLAVNNNMPVLELESICNGSITKTFLDIVESLYDPNEFADAINDKVTDLNKQVLQYENRRDRLVSLDIAGLAGAIAPLLPKLQLLPLGIWLANSLLLKSNKDFGKLGDILRSMMTLTPSDAIFISRVRSQLTGR